jgi:exocyst complex component 1
MLEIRQSVDGAYNRIVQTMFDSLKHMAKMSGDEEDKGQLNYHVIIVGKLDFSSDCRTINENAMF